MSRKSKSASAEIKKLRSSGALFFVQPEELDSEHREAILRAQREERASPDVSRRISNFQKALSKQSSLEFEFLASIKEEFRKLRRTVRVYLEEEREAVREDRRTAKLEKERAEFEKLSPLEQKRCLRLKKKSVKKSVRKAKLRKG